MFDVRFGPEQSGSPDEAWPNNIQLAGSGRAVVTAESVTFSDGRDAAPEGRRTFLMSDIANVGHGEKDGAHIVAVRSRADDREVLLWMASPQDARELLELLPKATTPEFMRHEREHREFRQNLAAIAPRARVTPAIIGINVAVFLTLLLAGAGLMQTSGDVELLYGANYGPLTWNGQPWRLLTAAFIHFGLIHLAFNMYALYNGGMWTERLFGSTRFAVIYLLSALAGSVISGWWDASRSSAGASGAVFGVYGALLVYFWRRPRDIPMDILKSVRTGAISLCVYSLAMGAILPFVDNAAHLGGFLGGALSGLLLVRPFTPAAREVPQPRRVAMTIAGLLLVLALIGTQVQVTPGGGQSPFTVDESTAKEFSEQRRLIELFTGILREVDAGKLGDREAATRVRNDVIPSWERSTRQLQSGLRTDAPRAPSMQWLDAYKEYAQAMREAMAASARRLESPGVQSEQEESEAAKRATRASFRLQDIASGKR